MKCRQTGLWLIVMMLLCLSQFAYANTSQTAQVPDASALLLAPMGLAAVIAAERRRRRMAKISHGVGIAYYFIKRLMDIVISFAALIAAFPIFLAVAVLIRLDSAGAIFFKRRVIGLNGKSFDMYKFRSMVVNAEEILQNDDHLKKEYYVNCKLYKDPRVTKLGKFLRKSSLDELPQLLNIFLGQMSFVGPRPIASDEVEIYGPDFERFKTVKPGITGIWQTCGRSETSYDKRVEMDMTYIEKRSIPFDLKIILLTIPAVLLKRGAV